MQPDRCFCFVLGGPGCGKGTQCQRVVEVFEGWKHLSVGNLLREEIATASETVPPLRVYFLVRDTQQGRQCEKYIQSGDVVPLDIVMKLLKEAVEKVAEQKFLIDGFPRDVTQIGAFQHALGGFACVLFYDCAEDVLLERLIERSASSGRSDDTAEIIQKRLQTFREVTLPVRRQLESMNKLKLISADGTIDEIFVLTSQEIQSIENAYSR